VAAGVLMIRRRRVVTRIDGSDDVVGPGSILAGNPRIHAAPGLPSPPRAG
jgi:hypothetical protein